MEIDIHAEIEFINNVDFCVGTGRMGLALGKEYMEQLEFVRKYIGFKHIRGHGIFADDMAIYHEYETDEGETRVEYNFTYLDLVMDGYLKLDIEPFIELGFMPGQLASGDQTIFYWRGNVTPPKDYSGWCGLVKATLNHLIGRYGRDRVVNWPVEVWNEPNLKGFWKDADMDEYFKLFEVTYRAVKETDPRFKVGGPAVCGGTDEIWIRAFTDFCEEHDIAPDFITRHHYTTGLPRPDGHYGYPPLNDPEEGFGNLHTTREIIDSHERYRGLPIHITEFNTSYVPNAPIHDTTRNAAYIAHQLSRLGDDNESYSYWTFGDVFEEQGVPFTPFHGGFGLVANGSIPKPVFWSFAFYKAIKGGRCVYKDDNNVVVFMPDKSLRGICWNYSLTGEAAARKIEFEVPAESEEYCLITKTVDELHANPLKIWHDLGEPKSPTEAQKELIREGAYPVPVTKRLAGRDGKVEVRLNAGSNAVVYWELTPSKISSDRGYDYGRTLAGEA